MLRTLLISLFVLGTFSLSCTCQASKWNVALQNNLQLDPNGFVIAEMSGVTYLGPGSTLGTHRFAAVEDNGGKVDRFEVELDLVGNLVSAATTDQLQLPQTLDFEGIAYTGADQDSIYVSEENNPGVREYDFSTGGLLQNLSIPSVFANRAGNRGFESLALSPSGQTMWTANEEALTVDGSLSTTSAGSVVRLLHLEADGGSYTAGSQYAYVTEPIHPGLIPNRSGLADLVALPDGTVLALERSASGLGSPTYLNSIYEIDFSLATDVSDPNFDSGLVGKSYIPVTKQLLWSGAIDGSAGQNLEGLTLGPRLASGDWVLVGVVDNSNGGDPFSSNTVVSFALSASLSADFNEDNRVDGLDFLAWQTGFGTTLGAHFSQGDADRDGDVDSSDLSIWSASYATSIGSEVRAVPEPSSVALALICAVLCLRPHRTWA